MSFGVASRPSAITRLPAPLRVRAFAAVGFGALSIVAATGLIATHVFHEPTTLKYAVTVIAPLLLSIACLTREPLRLLVGAAIVTAPWDLNVTLQGVKISPVTLLIALAAFVALLSPEHRGAARASTTATVVTLAVALLLPALAIGREQPHFVTWILATLAGGWLAIQIAREPGGLRFVLAMLVLAATAQGLIAFYEYARHTNLNLYSSEVNEAVSQHYFFSFASGFRPAGTLPDPDSLGNILALACPLALALAVEASTQLLRLAWATCALIITVALAISFSRMSWIGAAVGVLLVLAVLPGRRRLAASAGTVALLLATVLIGLSVGGAHLRERFSSIENPTARVNRTAQGDKEREQIWKASLATAYAHPAVGVGLGRLQEHLSENIGASKEGLHAQSVYFQFFAEAGIAGLLALALLLARTASGIFAGLSRERLLVAGVAGGFVAVLLGWITDTTARYTSVSVMIAFLFGAAMAQHRRVAAIHAGGRRRSSGGGGPRGELIVRALPSEHPALGEARGESRLVLNLARSVFHLLGRYGAITILSGLGTIAIIRLLGSSDYGQYAAAVATWAVLGATADFGFSLMLSRDLPHFEGPHRPILRSAYEIATAWSAVLALVMVGLAFSAGITSTRGLALLVLAPSMLFNGLNPARVFFLIRHRTGLLLKLDVVTTALQVATTVAVAALGFGVVAIAVALSAGSIINGLAVAFAAHRLLEPAAQRRVGRLALIRRSVPLGLLSIMTKVYLMIDLVLLGWLVTGSRLGDYAAASKLLTVLATAAGVVVSGSLPALSSLIGRTREVEFLVGRVWTWLAVGVMPIFVALALFAPPLVELALGDGYQSATPLLRILSLAGAISVANNLLGSLMIALHKTRALFAQNAAAIALNVIGNLILVPKVGVVASAWLTAGCELLVFLAALVSITREVDLRPCLAISLRPAAALLAAAATALVLQHWTVLAIPASAGVFIVMVAALRAWPDDFRPSAIAADLRRVG
jgi:O-antigen/teichoic acid export membrane protein/O-antigen ligase